jgi:hypothetical protein
LLHSISSHQHRLLHITSTSSMTIITRPRDINDPFYRSTSEDYTQAYHSIVKASRVGRSGASSSTLNLAAPVLLLVSTDIDAICATRSLVSLLIDDDVPYKVCPVDGYSTLTRIVQDDVEGNDSVSKKVELRSVTDSSDRVSFNSLPIVLNANSFTPSSCSILVRFFPYPTFSPQQ